MFVTTWAWIQSGKITRSVWGNIELEGLSVSRNFKRKRRIVVFFRLLKYRLFPKK